MRRAYLIYLLMFAILGAGLWVILTLGAAMKAPDDLSGDWTISWDGAPPPNANDPTMHIDQSGRFFVVRFGKKPPFSMRLQPGWKGARDGRKVRMQLNGEVWTLNLTGDIPLSSSWRVPELNVQLIGPSQHSGRAIRNGMEPTTRPAGVARAR